MCIILCLAAGCTNGTVLGPARDQAGVAADAETPSGKQRMKYKVTRLAEAPTIDAKWDKPPWNDIEPISIARYAGDKPAYIPRPQAKLAYDDQALYVIFRVEDRYVRAVARKHQDEVCGDSCVEFFFTPGTDVSKGYFNLEVNCGGTMLLRFQSGPQEGKRAFSGDECAQVQIAHSMPSIVDPEIKEPTTWTVEYRLPVAILEKYGPVTRPAPGVVWRANFYKCADLTSNPHWLTWSFVDRPTPNFHVPESFGILEFE